MSLILSDLYDNDEIVLGEGVDETTMTKEEYGKLSLTITEFLETYYTMVVDNEVTPIAAMVFPPINGTREIIVERSNKKLAIQWCKKLHCDLYTHMSLLAIQSTFENYEEIGWAAKNKHNLWTTNKLDSIIDEEEVEVDESKRGKKRSKTSIGKTYAKAASTAAQAPKQDVTSMTTQIGTQGATSNPEPERVSIPMQSITSMKETAILMERLNAMEIRQEQNELKLWVIGKLVEEQVVEMDTIKTQLSNTNNNVNLVLSDLTSLMTTIHTNFNVINAKLDAQGTSNKENVGYGLKRHADFEPEQTKEELEYQRQYEAQERLNEAVLKEKNDNNNGVNQSKSPKKSVLGSLSNLFDVSF